MVKDMKKEKRKRPSQWVTRALLAMMAFLLLSTSDSYAQVLTAQQKQAIQRRVKNKVEEFQFYLEQLGDRKFTNKQMRNEAYASALKLFVGNGDDYKVYDTYRDAYIVKNAVRIETSSKYNSHIGKKTVKAYMRNLKNDASYSQIVIESAGAVIVDDIYQVGDHYECMAYFCQKYISYREGRISYSDITEKKVRVRIEKIEIPRADGTTKTIWNALLGDIYVVSTR
jgi:hypothetical protein